MAGSTLTNALTIDVEGAFTAAAPRTWVLGVGVGEGHEAGGVHPLPRLGHVDEVPVVEEFDEFWHRKYGHDENGRLVRIAKTDGLYSAEEVERIEAVGPLAPRPGRSRAPQDSANALVCRGELAFRRTGGRPALPEAWSRAARHFRC